LATLLQEFTRLIAELNRRKVPYAVCGGWAMTIHGSPRATIDIDIMVQPAALPEAGQVAKDLGYIIGGAPLNFRDDAIQIRRMSKIDSVTNELLTIDFILVTDATRHIWNDRQIVTWEAGAISTVSRQGLIQLKRLSGRSQDLFDIERLENES
jgi:hypothetical protein